MHLPLGMGKNSAARNWTAGFVLHLPGVMLGLPTIFDHHSFGVTNIFGLKR